MIRSLVPQQVASLRSICVKICDRADGGQRVGGVGPADPHAQRPAAAQARAGLAHHRPRGVGGVPLHQLRARRGDTPRAHGPGGESEAGQDRKGCAARGRRSWALAQCEFRQGSGTVWHSRAPRYRHGRRGRVLRAGRRGRRRRPRVGQRGQGRVRAAGRAARKLRKGTGSAAGEREADALAQAQAAAVLGRRAGLGGRPRLLGRRAQLRVRLHPQDHDHAVAATWPTRRRSRRSRAKRRPGSTASATPCCWTSPRATRSRAPRPSRGWSSRARTRAQDRDVAMPQRRGPAAHAHGLVRSSSDASNTTVHAVRMPPARLQESTGHTKVVWSLAIRNATPHDASTSLVPGITEGIAHLHARGTGQGALRNNRHYAARVVERSSSRRSARRATARST